MKLEAGDNKDEEEVENKRIQVKEKIQRTGRRKGIMKLNEEGDGHEEELEEEEEG